MEALPNGLAFGGQLDSRFFGLWIHDGLESGTSAAPSVPCSTYHSPCLSPSGPEFAVDALEVWAVGDDPPPPSEEEAAAAAGENALTAAGVLSSKHEEAKAFVAIARKGPRVEASGGSV